jgi:hypothetical protein
MARGLLSVGEDYQGLATKGFIRADELEEQINMRNEEMSAEGKMQRQKMSMELTTTGAIGGAYAGSAAGSAMAGAGMGAAYGTWGGPVGAVVGAGLGFLVSKLF